MRKRILAYIKYMNARLERLEREAAGKGTGRSSDNGAGADETGAGAAKTGTGMQDGVSEELEKLKAEHLTQIAFFQHERLIHLIVTVLFAILEFMSLFLCMLVPNIGTMLLTIAVLVLLIPYIRHYYLLENEVQRMYEQYDRLQGLIGKDSFSL